MDGLIPMLLGAGSMLLVCVVAFAAGSMIDYLYRRNKEGDRCQ